MAMARKRNKKDENEVDEILQNFANQKLMKCKDKSETSLEDLEKRMKAKLEKNKRKYEAGNDECTVTKKKKKQKKDKTHKKKRKMKKREVQTCQDEEKIPKKKHKLLIINGHDEIKVEKLKLKIELNKQSETSNNLNGNEKTVSEITSMSDIKLENDFLGDNLQNSVGNETVKMDDKDIQNVSFKEVGNCLKGENITLPLGRFINSTLEQTEALNDNDAKTDETPPNVSKINNTEMDNTSKLQSTETQNELIENKITKDKPSTNLNITQENIESEKVETKTLSDHKPDIIKKKEHKNRNHRDKARKTSRERSHHKRSRSRSRERRQSRERSSHSHKSSHRSRKRSSPHSLSSRDKLKLLGIARSNALKHHGGNVGSFGYECRSRLESSTATVEEFTEVCQGIAKGKVKLDTHETKEELEERVSEARKIHHPFEVHDKPISFSLNPRPIPVKPVEQLSIEYPVSCGQQHHKKEVLREVYGKWEPVVKNETVKNVVKKIVEEEKVFPTKSTVDTNISTVIASRVAASRKLQDNPNDVEAMTTLFNVQQEIDAWTFSKNTPGRFTGSTNVQPLSKYELESGGRQAWAKKDMFENAKVVEGIGKSLLQKMGWRPGQSLGKTMQGALEPLTLGVKMDRKGLTCTLDKPILAQKHIPTAPGVRMDLSGKHPVSALMEICSKRRWPAPHFTLIMEPGLVQNLFMFKVQVNNQEYQGLQHASNKKTAKLYAATAALQGMGLLPKS